MATVLIADKEKEFVEGLAKVLRREDDVDVSDVTDAGGIAAALEACDPHVVVLGPSIDTDAAMSTGRTLAGRVPALATVMVAAPVTTELLRTAMRAGLHDVVSVEDTFGDVAAAVLEALASAKAERERHDSSSEDAPPAEVAPAQGAKVVTVFSTKGGVGKSVIATNLGVALASEEGVRTILLDLDLQFGDTGIMLQLMPKRTIFDAMLAYDRLDVEMLQGFLTEHESGLKVLLAPVHPEDAEAVTASRVARIIGLLREIADVVVIDTPGAFTDTVLAALDKSDEVYAIATMDVASIKNTRISLQKLAQLGYDDDRIKLVLNRADSKVWIEPGEVESAVEGDIVAKIPSDRLVPRSVNKGVPVVVDAPKSPVAKALVSLARLAASRNGEAI